ncbi:unnamed protein product, partial [marine sediment metagenome]
MVNKKAQDEFVTAMNECRNECNKILDVLDNHLGVHPNQVDYSHVAEARW